MSDPNLENRTPLSTCDQYRYWRLYDTPSNGSKICCFIMFNPTGKNRPEGTYGRTIQKCRKFAAKYGCGTLATCNLFARKDYPDGKNKEDLPNPPDPDEIERENNQHIAEMIGGADMIVCAWGNDPKGMKVVTRRALQIVTILAAGNTDGKLYALALNETDHPCHPARAGMSTPIPLRIVDGKLQKDTRRTANACPDA